MGNTTSLKQHWKSGFTEPSSEVQDLVSQNHELLKESGQSKIKLYKKCSRVERKSRNNARSGFQSCIQF